MNYQIFGIFLSVAAIIGPHSAKGEVIDPRFPDYIVDPLVDCPFEGFFEHPRNCSWFYRCHVSENITDLGIYRRDYFECAPGTAFSTETSICDFESYESCNPDYCDACASVFVDYCDYFDVCPDPDNKNNRVSLVLCENPKYECENCTDMSPCNEGEWIISLFKKRQNHVIQRQSSGLHVCFPSPYSPEVQCPVCTDCTIATRDCISHTANDCLNADMTLCTATYICAGCSEQNVCEEGLLYSQNDGTCYPSYYVNDCYPLCSRCVPNTNGCQSYEVCPEGRDKVTMTLCSGAERFCSGCSPLTVCDSGMYYSVEEDRCFPSPDSSDMMCKDIMTPIPVPCTDCSLSTSECHKYEVCPDGENHVHLTLCSIAENYCNPCQSTQRICGDGQFYSLQDEKCYPNPETILCPACNDCYVSTSRCQTFEVCPSGGPKQSMSLCPISKRVCDPCGSEENVCPSGKHYSMETATCHPPPADQSMQCSPQSNIKRDSSPPSKYETVRNNYPVLECSARNLYPQDLWIKEKFCKNYQPCSRGSEQPSGVIELCTSYYECTYRDSDQTWNAVKNKCARNMLFSYEGETCVTEPKNICRVY